MFVSSWNIWFKEVFEGGEKSTIVLQQKHLNEQEQKDLHGQYSFNIVVDWLRTPDLRKFYLKKDSQMILAVLDPIIF